MKIYNQSKSGAMDGNHLETYHIYKRLAVEAFEWLFCAKFLHSFIELGNWLIVEPHVIELSGCLSMFMPYLVPQEPGNVPVGDE